jgi:cell division protein FtsQ
MIKQKGVKMINNRSYLIFTLACALLIIVVAGFAHKRVRQVKTLEIQIEKYKGHAFVTEEEVLALARGEENVLSLPVSKWDMNEMEKRIEENPFIKDAQVFRDVKGNVLVQISQRKPIARWLKRNRQDSYIDEEGNLLPTTGEFTARVPVIEIEGLQWEQNLKESPYGQKLLNLLQYIDEERFWRTQIAHLLIRRNGQVEMIPQLSKQRIYFGMPADIEDKFSKLMLFYEKILPVKGWNAYSSVNLKYKDQIICE